MSITWSPPLRAKNLSLPTFRYHPDPITTGSVIASKETCVCCEQETGYIYTGDIYCEEDLPGAVCPWCIADGSAARRFDALFFDDEALVRNGAPEAVVEEITRRTPGFISWRQEWPLCCSDACEFHGDPDREPPAASADPTAEKPGGRVEWSPEEEWVEFFSTHEPRATPAVCLFVCRHCKQAPLIPDSD